MAYRTVTITNGDTVRISESVLRGSGPQGPQGIQGPIGPATVIRGTYADYAALIAAHPTGGDQGDGYVTVDDGHLWAWDYEDSTWKDGGKITGPPGAESIQAQRTATTVALTDGVAALVTYDSPHDFNDTDPQTYSVLKNTTTATDAVPGNTTTGHLLVMHTLALTGYTDGTLTVTMKQVAGTPGDTEVHQFRLVTGETDTITCGIVLRTTDADSWRVELLADGTDATVSSLVTTWTRLGGGTGPQGEIGPPPTMVAGTATKLLPAANPTVAVVDLGGGTYQIDLGIPQGEDGNAFSGFDSHNAVTSDADSTVDPGGSPQLYGDQAIPIPLGTQKPNVPYFLEQIVALVHDRLVGRATTAEITARAPITPGEIVYNEDTDVYTMALDNNGTPTRFTIPGIEFGTSAIAHNDATDRPDGFLYFKHEA